MKEGGQLQITLEVVDVENNRTLWRDTLNVPAADMITTRAQISDKVRQGMIPALGGTESAESSTRPNNEEAYDLYLRSLAISRDGAPNKEGIAMLERAVGLDPTYAPAWANLGRRYYLDSQYGGGGEAMFEKANTALEQALKLDPNLTLAAAQRIATRVERGDLLKAYQDAQALVERQPKSSIAHVALGYMLRYPGLLDESAKACNDAYALDSGNYLLRACSFTFSQMGNPQRSMEFISLDAGSDYYKGNRVRILLREGKVDEARAGLKELDADDGRTKFFEVCLARPSASRPAFAESDRTFREHVAKLETNPDPENRYLDATDMAYCGEKEAAVRFLKSAIEGKYCSYDALQKDPLLASIRSMPEYPQLLAEAKECRDRFVAERNGGR
jgi:tetratricopeptide (TPR) repeat protein